MLAGCNRTEMKARKRGRPPKEEEDKHSYSVFIRMPTELKKAVQAFQKSNMLATESEAVRQLLLMALRSQKLL